jgi:hypothetical protein
MVENNSLYATIVKEWNDNVDGYNQWEALSEDEKVEFAYSLGKMLGLMDNHINHGDNKDDTE